MSGPGQEAQAVVFQKVLPEDDVPQAHLLRFIDRFVDLSGICAHLANYRPALLCFAEGATRTWK